MSTRTVLINANLLDGENPAKPGTTIVVEGERIAFVGGEAPQSGAGDEVIDCNGYTVMPGLVSGHFHPTYRDVTNVLVPPLGYERSPAMHAYVAAETAKIAIRAGVTSVVGANCPYDIEPALRDAIDAGMFPGPRVIPGSRDLITTADSNDTVPWWWESKALAGIRICDGPGEFRRAVRDEVRRGAEIIKLFASGGHGVRLAADTCSMTKRELEAAVEAAHGLGARVRAHVASKRAILRCLELGVDVIDHGDGLDDECIQALVETGAFLLPSMHAFVLRYEILDPTKEGPVPPGLRSMCEALPAAVEAGVKLCLGDDFGGRIIPHGTYGLEPASYVHYAGIKPLEVLRWGTANGGLLVGRNDLGRIEAGYFADLLVTKGDPSVDISVLGTTDNILGVMRSGQFVITPC